MFILHTPEGTLRPLGATCPPGAIQMEETNMRLAGIEKGGFYPYPIHMAEATAYWFIPPPNGARGRILDPCAGEGKIAAILVELLNCKTWGCELFPHRAEKAATRMDKCHSTAWESCSLTDESVTLLWLNAPYDDDRHGQEKRLELAFLKSTTPKLVGGGVLAFLIPQRILGLTMKPSPSGLPDGEYGSSARCYS